MATERIILMVLAAGDNAGRATELLGAARAAARNGMAIVALALDTLHEDAQSILDRAGIAGFYDLPFDAGYAADPETTLHALEQAARALKPAVIALAGASDYAIASRLAHRLGAAYVSDCCAIA